MNERISIPGHEDWAEGEIVAGEDIRVGDFIVGMRHSSYSDGTWTPWIVRGMKGEMVISIDESHPRRIASGNLGYLTSWNWLVKTRGTAPTSSKRKSDAWNGRCPKCGRGTYQGFMTLEHEGGGCHA